MPVGTQLPWQRLLPLLTVALALLGCCGHFGSAFYPVGDDMNMEFLTNDSKAKADMDRMMLMNTDDPKLRDEAHEAFREIMRAKRLSKLQECRRACVVDHEDAAEFRSCNEQCEAAHEPGVYGDLPTLFGTEAQPEGQQQESKKNDEAAAPASEDSKPAADDTKGKVEL